MIVQQATPLESLGALCALVTFIIIVSSSFVGLQITALTESGTTEFTLIWFFSSVCAFMIPNLGLPGKCFTTHTANKGFKASMHNSMHF